MHMSYFCLELHVACVCQFASWKEVFHHCREKGGTLSAYISHTERLRELKLKARLILTVFYLPQPWNSGLHFVHTLSFIQKKNGINNIGFVVFGFGANILGIHLVTTGR